MLKVDYLYIMGRGHSGSTMLDIVLGNNKNIASVGELISGIVNKNGLCGCKSTFEECKFWSDVRTKFEKTSGVNWYFAGKEIRNQANIKSLLSTLLPFLNPKEKKQLSIYHSILVKSLLVASGKDCIVDSSKEFTRAMFLAKHSKSSRIVFLVKNPQEIIASNIYRLRLGEPYRLLRYRFKGPELIFVLISSLSWLIGNLIGEIVCLISKNKPVRIRFEDLVDNPITELKKIEDQINGDFSDIYQRINNQNEFYINHNLGGNRIKFFKSLTLKTKSDVERKSNLFYRFVVTLFCWPLMMKYKYL